VPEHFEKVYFNWLENIRDWCISRQLWWGHRIPVWYCPDGHMTTGRADPVKCGTCRASQLEQDPDVLDTWFSSGLWPFSTLGWPDATPDYEYFYPTSYMETGYDILFFWVARMIMLGLEFTGEAPFHTVYLHGLIRDEHGRKMSKTTGNTIDPLLLMDDFGTDALRFTLLVGSAPGSDMSLSAKKVETNRNFANKIWNAGRFVAHSVSMPHVPSSAPTLRRPGGGGRDDWTLADQWIWARLEQLIRSVERLFQTFQYGEAGRQIYEFFWADFADWYVEVAKDQLRHEETRQATLLNLIRVMDLSLRMLHPFTPFVTEEIWGHLRTAVLGSAHADFAAEWADALIVASWPAAREPEPWEQAAIADFGLVQEIVRSIRNLRAERVVPPAHRIAASIVAGRKTGLIREHADAIAWLAGLDGSSLTVHESIREPPADSVVLVVGPLEIYLPLSGLVDSEKERTRLERELAEADAQIVRLEALLAGDFSAKAPAGLVQKERARLASFQEKADKLRGQLG